MPSKIKSLLLLLKDMVYLINAIIDFKYTIIAKKVAIKFLLPK